MRLTPKLRLGLAADEDSAAVPCAGSEVALTPGHPVPLEPALDGRGRSCWLRIEENTSNACWAPGSSA